MTVTGGLISWGGICATYLRFRKACRSQSIAIEPEAASPWQPVLAWYGLVWIIFLSTLRAPRYADIELFSKVICRTREAISTGPSCQRHGVSPSLHMH